MPLFLVPIVLGGLSLVTGAYGVSKVHEGLSGLATAEKMCEDARKQFERRFKVLDRSRKETDSDLKRLDKERDELRAETVRRFRIFLLRLQKRIRQRVGEHGSRFPAGSDLEEWLEQFRPDSLEAAELFQALTSGATTGMAAGNAASYLAAQFGVASTGAAISGLSGAAAESATLAWLGGGSLAAGGGGMALGSIILGGITVAPALLLGGLTVAGQGEKALTKAEEYVSQARYETAKVDSQIEFLSRVRRRIEEVREVMLALNGRALRLLDELDPDEFDPDDARDAGRFAILDGLVKALQRIAKIPVLNPDGEMNLELTDLLKRWRIWMAGYI